jgi:hypothetical protein
MYAYVFFVSELFFLSVPIPTFVVYNVQTISPTHTPQIIHNPPFALLKMKNLFGWFIFGQGECVIQSTQIILFILFVENTYMCGVGEG